MTTRRTFVQHLGIFGAAVVARVPISLRGADAPRLLVAMDDTQQNHLKAYGLAYSTIKAGTTAEWLLNYRGGSFLLANTPDVKRQAALARITTDAVHHTRPPT